MSLTGITSFAMTLTHGILVILQMGGINIHVIFFTLYRAAVAPFCQKAMD